MFRVQNTDTTGFSFLQPNRTHDWRVSHLLYQVMKKLKRQRKIVRSHMPFIKSDLEDDKRKLEELLKRSPEAEKAHELFRQKIKDNINCKAAPEAIAQ